jgi:hypothetical protein
LPAPPARPRSAPSPDATIELSDVDLSELAPPLRRSKSVERTVELSSSELVIAEDTIPITVAPEFTAEESKVAADPPVTKSDAASRKKSRNRKRRERRKRKREKSKR